MVKFKLISKKNGIYIYAYYPEGDFSKKYGTIKLDSNKKEIEILTVAEEDFLQIITTKELIESRNSIYEYRKENGEPFLSEEELPTSKEDIEYYYYGSHVISRIWKDFKNNTLKKDGMVAWY